MLYTIFATRPTIDCGKFVSTIDTYQNHQRKKLTSLKIKRWFWKTRGGA